MSFVRHIPRLCASCEAPMARQEATCWRCGITYTDALPPGPAEIAVERWATDGGRGLRAAPTPVTLGRVA